MKVRIKRSSKVSSERLESLRSCTWFKNKSITMQLIIKQVKFGVKNKELSFSQVSLSLCCICSHTDCSIKQVNWIHICHWLNHNKSQYLLLLLTVCVCVCERVMQWQVECSDWPLSGSCVWIGSLVWVLASEFWWVLDSDSYTLVTHWKTEKQFLG